MENENIDKFVKFLENFDLTRPGCYTVPPFVYKECLRTFLNNGDMSPLLCYENVLYKLWSSNSENTILSDKDISFLDSFLGDNEYWKSRDSIINDKEYEQLINFCNKQKADKKNRLSYGSRRTRADTFISKDKVRRVVFDRDGNKCKNCKSVDKLSIDHVISVKNGGGNELSNLQTLCSACNSKKGCI